MLGGGGLDLQEWDCGCDWNRKGFLSLGPGLSRVSLVTKGWERHAHVFRFWFLPGGGGEAVGIMGWYGVVLEIVFFFSFLFSLEYCINWGVQADTCGTRALNSSELILGEMRNAGFLVRERERNDIWCRYCRTGPEDRGGHSY